MLYQPVSQWRSLHFELLIELVAQKLTELWRFENLAYFFTWWPSSMTYLFVNVTYWNCSPIPYVDQVWWWYVKAFMSYAWQNWQTNRQTDRQTNRQTNILAKNCKFWQVTNKKNPWISCLRYHTVKWYTFLYLIVRPMRIVVRTTVTICSVVFTAHMGLQETTVWNIRKRCHSVNSIGTLFIAIWSVEFDTDMAASTLLHGVPFTNVG